LFNSFVNWGPNDASKCSQSPCPTQCHLQHPGSQVAKMAGFPVVSRSRLDWSCSTCTLNISSCHWEKIVPRFVFSDACRSPWHRQRIFHLHVHPQAWQVPDLFFGRCCGN
jgi:hypothetical protein